MPVTNQTKLLSTILFIESTNFYRSAVMSQILLETHTHKYTNTLLLPAPPFAMQICKFDVIEGQTWKNLGNPQRGGNV